MNIRIQLLSPLKERAGASELVLALQPPATVAALLEKLAEEYPSLAPFLKNAQIIINQQMVYKLHTVNEGDEVILFAPVFGG